MTERGLSFGPAAERYDRYRPSYPPEALRWMLGEAPLRVVDLGAGTGILTRTVEALGHAVTAVEPDDAMRARLTATTPGVTALAGSAEAIPLPDGSVDAVVAGQAYHWFKRDVAMPEIARVLVPGGVFAPIWNIRDERVPWVERLSHLADDLAERRRIAPEEHPGGPDLGPLFTPAERRDVEHATPMTADWLVAMMSTRSYYLISTPRRQREIDAALRDLVAGMPSPFPMPYVTEAYRARRR